VKLSPFLLILVASAAFAHPGKTDYQDGHKCLKNCEEWDMGYEEYHLHDKDRNAIRMEGRKKSVREPAPAKKSGSESSKQEVVAAPVPSLPEVQAKEIRRTAPNVIVARGYSMPVEAGFVLTLYDIILLGVAGLLLLVMLILRIKERKNNSL
jgi:hypothetical protein